MARINAEIDTDGRIVLPDDVKRELGLRPGDRITIDQANGELLLHVGANRLRKVYIEATNACNLQCRTCMRNGWDESPGFMGAQTFRPVMERLSVFSPMPSIFFGGFGEPLFHPDIVEMVAEAKAMGAVVELITNGTLLTKKMSQVLVEAGLDRLWVSLDGAKPDSYADVRLGAMLPEVINNINTFRSMCRLDSSLFLYPERPSLGVVFVAMRRNIADLPHVIELSNRLGARQVLVTNVLPYTVEMSEETLYSRVVRNMRSPASHLQLPRWDNEKLFGLLPDNLGNLYNISWDGEREHSAVSCPFIRGGSLSINWKGNISPCLPLMYNHTDFLEGQPRFSKSYHVGNVAVDQLDKVWNDSEYVAFRERIMTFDFPPCTACGGCYLWEQNEEDCFGSPFPACGGCLWAQGIVRCP